MSTSLISWVTRVPYFTQDNVPDLEEGEKPEADASGADNSEAALALLRALSRADPEVICSSPTPPR